MFKSLIEKIGVGRVFRSLGVKTEIASLGSDNEIHHNCRKRPLEQDDKQPSDFDKQLEQEVKRAKSIRDGKLKRRQNQKNIKSEIVRDKSGFKLRAVSNGNKAKNGPEEPEYEVEIAGPLRKIKPYYFTYKTFCKLRWRDRHLLDVFVTEFRDRSAEYYKQTIKKGAVYLNDKPADIESIIRNGDMITHKIHRHEPPVTSKPVEIVFEDDDILVISKPSGIPVHPTGRYRFNTITKMLQRERGYVVHPCNRLDRMTSGLMFLAKTSKGADTVGDQMKTREVTKEYLARVVGEFPENEIVVDKPLKLLEPRVTLNVVCEESDADGKHARTTFERISVSKDRKTSIVRCKPLTGRSHQIRVHLQYLGYPISNDPIYSSPLIWGESLGKNGEANFEDVIQKLDKIGKSTPASTWDVPVPSAMNKGTVLTGQLCPECQTDLYSDPGPNDLELYLHAFKYESKDNAWSYKTRLPHWATI